MRDFGQRGYAGWLPWEWGEQTGATGGQCVDREGMLGKPGARVPCAALDQAMTGRETRAYIPVADDEIAIGGARVVDPSYELRQDAADLIFGGDSNPPSPEKPSWAPWAMAGVGLAAAGTLYWLYRQPS
jgi:hypothetical protein